MPRADTRFFIVPGRPQGKQRPRVVRGRAFTPKETVAFEKKIREHYLNVHGGKPPFEGDVAVDVFAFFRSRRHPDLDNVVKTLDALNKVAWNDDKQIKHINAYLIVDATQEERLAICIRPAKDSMKNAIKNLPECDTQGHFAPEK